MPKKQKKLKKSKKSKKAKKLDIEDFILFRELAEYEHMRAAEKEWIDRYIIA